jgi:hypothetical protein
MDTVISFITRGLVSVVVFLAYLAEVFHFLTLKKS